MTAPRLLNGTAGLARRHVANDITVRRVVRLLRGGDSHHPVTGAEGYKVPLLCGRTLYGAVVWSSGTESTCEDCARLARRERGAAK